MCSSRLNCCQNSPLSATSCWQALAKSVCRRRLAKKSFALLATVLRESCLYSLRVQKGVVLQHAAHCCFVATGPTESNVTWHSPLGLCTMQALLQTSLTSNKYLRGIVTAFVLKTVVLTSSCPCSQAPCSQDAVLDSLSCFLTAMISMVSVLISRKHFTGRLAANYLTHSLCVVAIYAATVTCLMPRLSAAHHVWSGGHSLPINLMLLGSCPRHK